MVRNSITPSHSGCEHDARGGVDSVQGERQGPGRVHLDGGVLRAGSRRMREREITFVTPQMIAFSIAHLFPSPFARPPTRPTPSRPSLDGNGTPDDEMFLAAPPLTKREKGFLWWKSKFLHRQLSNDNIQRDRESKRMLYRT